MRLFRLILALIVKLSSRQRFIRLLNFGPPKARTHFTGLAILQAIVSFLDLLSVAFVASVLATAVKSDITEQLLSYVNEHFTVNRNQLLVSLALVSLVLFIGKNIFAYQVANLSLKYAEKMTSHLSTQLVKKFYDRGFSYLKGEKIFKITHRTSSMPFEFSAVTIKSAFSLISQLSVCLAFVVFALVLSIDVTIFLVLAALPVVVIMYLRHSKRAEVFGREKNEKLPSNNRALHKLYESFIELKIYGAEKLFINNFLHHLNGFNSVRFKQQKLVLYPKRILEALAVTLILVLFIFRVVYSAKPEVFLLDLLVLGVFGYKVIPAVAGVLDNLVVFNTTKDAQTNLITNLVTDVAKKNQPIHEGSIEQIALKKVGFRLGKQSILKNIDLSIEQGSIVGISGRSGSGKSTLLKIILGLLDMSEGDVFINQKKQHIFNNDQWYEKLGYIGEDSTLLDMTIYENVCLGVVDENKILFIEEALRAAGLSSFTGADRAVGEDGANLSSGEKQRLALARALYHKPEILVLDEFTSHLDSETEDELLSTIQTANEKNRTTMIIVSHRHSTLSIAEERYDLENGNLRRVVH